MCDTATDEGEGGGSRDVFLLEGVRVRIEQAMLALLQSLQYAEDVQRSPWDFAIDLPQLRKLGLTANDLRWLVCKGYVVHAQEVPAGTDQPVTARGSGDPLIFHRTTRFCITASGARWIRRDSHPHVAAAAPAAGPAEGNGDRDRPTDQATGMPQWDSDRRELRFSGQLIKRFQFPAPDQEVVLTAFQAAGWPPVIQDPLPGCADVDRKRRLDDIVGRLNHHAQPRLLRFEADGAGRSVRWIG